MSGLETASNDRVQSVDGRSTRFLQDSREFLRGKITVSAEASRSQTSVAPSDREALLSNGSNEHSIATTTGHRRIKNRRKAERSSEVLHQMEEGGSRSRSPSSSQSSQSDDYYEEHKHVSQRLKIRASRRRRWFGFTAIHIATAILFVGIAFGAYRATRATSPQAALSLEQMLSNGTSLFAATTILISLDGFRADYLDRGLSPVLQSFVMNGVSPEYMLPSFPSVTFPNHFTLATGLYPESHGIVGNSFYDPDLAESFYYTDPSHSMQPKWWQGEPFWVTAEVQRVPTAIHMWPGSEAHISKPDPTYVDKFNGSEILDVKVARILELLDKPGPFDENSDLLNPRPRLIAAYVPDVDANGHLYGPNSTEVNASIGDVDGLLHGVLTGLQERNLTEVVNIIVVSDHGMASTDESRVIQLEDLVDTSKIAHFDGWPHYGLRPHDDADVRPLFESLLEAQKRQDGFDVYLRDENMPERWHFTDNDRIAPLWIFPRTGWAIAPKADFDKANSNAVYHPKGIHGYDHEHPLMRAIFVARGPAFPHVPGSKLAPFQNTEVYNIVCDSVGIEPRPNNGTLRLPLQPIGQHDLPHAENKTEENPSEGLQDLSEGFASDLKSQDDNSPTLTDALPARPTTEHAQLKDKVTDAANHVVDGAKHWWSWVTDTALDAEAWFKSLVAHDHGVEDAS